MTQTGLEGTWRLQSFTLQKGGVTEPWGSGVHGTLIYTPTGHMSVALNREMALEHPNRFEAIWDATLFYSGTYDYDPVKKLVRHRVTESSNPERIGQELVRTASLSGDTLTLSSPTESFGVATLVWKRVTT